MEGGGEGSHGSKEWVVCSQLTCGSLTSDDWVCMHRSAVVWQWEQPLICHASVWRKTSACLVGHDVHGQVMGHPTPHLTTHLNLGVEVGWGALRPAGRRIAARQRAIASSGPRGCCCSGAGGAAACQQVLHALLCCLGVVVGAVAAVDGLQQQGKQTSKQTIEAGYQLQQTSYQVTGVCWREHTRCGVMQLRLV